MMPDFEGEKIHVSNKPFRLFLYQFVIWGDKALTRFTRIPQAFHQSLWQKRIKMLHVIIISRGLECWMLNVCGFKCFHHFQGGDFNCSLNVCWTWGFYSTITSMEMCDDPTPERSQLLWTASQLKELKSTLLALSMMQRMEEKKGRKDQGSSFWCSFFLQMVRVFLLLEVCVFWESPLPFFFGGYVNPCHRCGIPSWFSFVLFWEETSMKHSP